MARFARRFAGHAGMLAYEVPDGLRGVSGGRECIVAVLFIAFDTRLRHAPSLARLHGRQPVFVTSRSPTVLLDHNVLGVNTPFTLTLT